jgi:hypothetical protein
MPFFLFILFTRLFAGLRVFIFILVLFLFLCFCRRIGIFITINFGAAYYILIIFDEGLLLLRIRGRLAFCLRRVCLVLDFLRLGQVLGSRRLTW